AVDKLGEILDLPLERSQGEAPPCEPGSTGTLRVREVELGGSSGRLSDVSFELSPGERLSVSAESDVTTSELVHAIFGLDTIRAGVIEVGGHDIRDLTLPALRSRVALVRGPEVFPGRVFDNLRAANSSLSSEEAWKVLDRVGLYDAVKQLPSGLQTSLLVDGAPLSRSQAVALTVARAIASEPSVLVLDRTLDHLDPHQSIRLIERLNSTRSFSLLVVSDDPRMHERMDRHLHITERPPRQNEAA
ncbi:MAG: ABC transporter ATP-binding protein, partial [Polyangiales bacterium]